MLVPDVMINPRSFYRLLCSGFYQFYENATDFLQYPDSTKDIEDQVNHSLEVNQTDFKYYFDSVSKRDGSR